MFRHILDLPANIIFQNAQGTRRLGIGKFGGKTERNLLGRSIDEQCEKCHDKRRLPFAEHQQNKG